MGGFIIVDDKRDIRNEMHERMNNRRGVPGTGGYRSSHREYDEGYREGYEHGYRDHEEDMTDMEHPNWRTSRYGR